MTIRKPAPVGQKFNRLTVISEAKDRIKPSGTATRYMNCICECGVEKEILLVKLKSGEVVSCGCYLKEVTTKRSLTHGADRRGKRTKEYNTWCHMKQRCLNKNNISYKDYGGRGIKIFDEWINSFDAFFSYIGKAPDLPDVSIDRINNDGNYEPGNVRWASRESQNNNKRTLLKKIKYQGEEKSVSEWAKFFGVKYETLRKRIHKYEINKAFENL